MKPKLRVGLVYDFRNTPDTGMDNASLYAAILDQVAWLDGLGLDLVWFTEHHFMEDGYLPSWVPVAAAMGSRTRRARFSCAVCLAPFNHPVRLAEDLAVLDNLTGGRIEVGIGMGYAPHEFRAFGLPQTHRLSLTDEALDVLRLCFSGERFSYRGKRYEFEDVLIRPGYVQAGGPPLWVAAMSEAGARRVARVDANLLPQGPRALALDPWRAQLAEAGRDASAKRVGIIRSCLVTDDPDRDWPPIRDAERYRAGTYAQFQKDLGPGVGAGGVRGVEGMERIPQTWVVGNADHCVAELSAFVRKYGITDLVGWAAPPGLPPERMNPYLQRLFTEVVPRLKAAVDG